MDVSEAERLLFGAWERVSANELRLGFEGLSPAEQVFSVIWMLEAELNNGGFSQYLFNSTGDRCPSSPSALRAVGATEAAELCERFYALLPGGAPAPTQEERQEQLDSAANARGEDQRPGFLPSDPDGGSKGPSPGFSRSGAWRHTEASTPWSGDRAERDAP